MHNVLYTHAKRAVVISLCIVMCVGASMNMGWTRFYLGTPFALLLLQKTWVYADPSKRRAYISIGMIFIASCIALNLSGPTLHMFFPNLDSTVNISAGCAFVEKHTEQSESTLAAPYNAYITDHWSTEEKSINKEQCLREQTNISSYDALHTRFIESGSYPVVGVYFNYQDMGYKAHYLLQIDPSTVAADARQMVQSEWTLMLSHLMYYPIVPFIVLGFLRALM